MIWKILIVGIALVLVLEGIMPFIMPERYKRFLLHLSHMSPKALRTMGLIMMVVGVVIIIVMKRVFGI